MELLRNRYLLTVTRCSKLKPEGVEVVIEIRPKPPPGQEPPAAHGPAPTNRKAPPEVSRE
jgi:hypothetical protein